MARLRAHHVGVAAAAWAIMAAAVVTVGKRPAPSNLDPDGTETAPPTPEATALRRCRDLREVALSDPSCKALWAENRRRFLGTKESTHSRPEGAR